MDTTHCNPAVKGRNERTGGIRSSAMRGEMKISQDESQDEMGNEQTGVTGWGEQVYLSWQSKLACSFGDRVYMHYMQCQQ